VANSLGHYTAGLLDTIIIISLLAVNDWVTFDIQQGRTLAEVLSHNLVTVAEG